MLMPLPIGNGAVVRVDRVLPAEAEPLRWCPAGIDPPTRTVDDEGVVDIGLPHRLHSIRDQ